MQLKLDLFSVDFSDIISLPWLHSCFCLFVGESKLSGRCSAPRSLGKALFPAFYHSANFVSSLCLSLSYEAVWVSGGEVHLTL